MHVDVATLLYLNGYFGDDTVLEDRYILERSLCAHLQVSPKNTQEALIKLFNSCFDRSRFSIQLHAFDTTPRAHILFNAQDMDTLRLLHLDNTKGRVNAL